MQAVNKPGVSRRNLLLGFGAVATAAAVPTAVRLASEVAAPAASTFDPAQESICTINYCRNTEYRKLMREEGTWPDQPGRVPAPSLSSPFGESLVKASRVNPAITQRDLVDFMARVDGELTKTLPITQTVHLPGKPIVMAFPAMHVGQRPTERDMPLLMVGKPTKDGDCALFQIGETGALKPYDRPMNTNSCGISDGCWEALEGYVKGAKSRQLAMTI